MTRNKNKFFRLAKWLVMLIAYAYLVYKLANISYWEELKQSFISVNPRQVFPLVLVFVLMPLNWAIEIKKWQTLTANVVKIPFKIAAKSVLAGLTTGFITPSRVGEFAGRVLYLPEKKRGAGTVLAFVSGITQTVVITVCGLPAAFLYFKLYRPAGDYTSYFLIVTWALVLILALFFLFPGIFGKIKNRSWTVRFQETLKSLSELKIKTLLYVLAISVVRYGLFCFQYYLLLCFFSIELTPAQALAGIPTMYLIITYTPTLAASEAAVRGSAAVLVLSVFSSNEIGILLTGILIWMINFILPMVAGTLWMVKDNKQAE